MDCDRRRIEKESRRQEVEVLTCFLSVELKIKRRTGCGHAGRSLQAVDRPAVTVFAADVVVGGGGADVVLLRRTVGFGASFSFISSTTDIESRVFELVFDETVPLPFGVDGRFVRLLTLLWSLGMPNIEDDLSSPVSSTDPLLKIGTRIIQCKYSVAIWHG